MIELTHYTKKLKLGLEAEINFKQWLTKEHERMRKMPRSISDIQSVAYVEGRTRALKECLMAYERAEKDGS